MFSLKCKSVMLKSLMSIKNYKLRSFLLDTFGYESKNIADKTQRYVNQKFDIATSELLATMDLALDKHMELLKLDVGQENNITKLRHCLTDLRCLGIRSFDAIEKELNALDPKLDHPEPVIEHVRNNKFPSPHKLIRSAYMMMLKIKVEKP